MNNSALIFCVSFFWVVGYAQAGESSAAKAPMSKPVIAAQVDQGMRAYIDPVTGKLTSTPPTQVQRAPAPPEFQSDRSKVTTEIREDGTEIDYLNGQGEQAIVAHRGADGKLEMICTDVAESKTTPQQTKDQSNER